MRKNENVCLVFTSLDEFWDTSFPIVFTGSGCCRFTQKAKWEPYVKEILHHPLRDIQSIQNAYKYTTCVYNVIMKRLVEVMNSIHGENYDVRYWTILFGFWLDRYIQCVYWHYVALMDAIGKYPRFFAFGLANENFFTPRDYTEAMDFVTDDWGVLQIYTQMLDFHDINIKKKKFVKFKLQTEVENAQAFDITYHNNNHKMPIKNIIAMRQGYFPNFTGLRFGSIVQNMDHVDTNLEWNFKKNLMIRRYLDVSLEKDDDFTKLVVKSLLDNMPLAYIEAYSYIKKIAFELFPFIPKAIFSAVGWYNDEAFKQWAAYCCYQGTLLLGSQHGCCYGTSAFSIAENHEKRILDKFYTWGWSEPKNSKVIPMPANKLTGSWEGKKIDKNSEGKILFVSSMGPRFTKGFLASVADNYDKYFNWQMDFINSLNDYIKRSLRVRLYCADYGNDWRARYETFLPDIQLEDWTKSFYESMKDCELIICDHVATTFLETLAVNKAAISYYDYSQPENQMRKQAIPYFEKLESVNIIFSDPILAANHINNIYGRIHEWWEDEDRQAIIKEFCNQHAYVTETGFNKWRDEFYSVLNEDICGTEKLSKWFFHDADSIEVYMTKLSEKLQGKRVALYSASLFCEYLLGWLKDTDICCIIDSDEKKWGQLFCGVPICSLQEAIAMGIDIILIAHLVYASEIEDMIKKALINLETKPLEVVNIQHNVKETVLTGLIRLIYGMKL